MSTSALRRLPLIDELLADQRAGTAVEEFAQRHAQLDPAVARYRTLLPLEAPRAGQQYAFDVDLDRCTGCKACVTGCHNLNGLDEGEVWRTVGLLHGGSAAAPVHKTVTSACHHCVEPACLIGCPVQAYEKDPLTGIVKHLDDQCIGCQYCVLLCPYDAPKFNAARGIVRKCDLCSDRLAHDEAPACVQACPNQAIRITVVEQADAVEASAFLPGAPAPDHTLPTTVYRTRTELPRNLVPADFYTLDREHAHPPLVVMLVLTQLSVGAMVMTLARRQLGGSADAGAAPAWTALALGVAALGASLLHLGRPRYAFRALLGLRRSWLSREILVFSLFAGVSSGYAASFALAPLAPLRPALLWLAAGSGLAGVFSSVMVYEATRRPSWRFYRAGPTFFASTLLLGAATVVAVAACTGRPAAGLAAAWIAVAIVKLAGEATIFFHLRSRRHTALKRRAILMAGDLRAFTAARFACGLGGAALALALLRPGGGAGPIVAALAGAVLTLGGELCERHLFFTAATALHMPGGAA